MKGKLTIKIRIVWKVTWCAIALYGFTQLKESKPDGFKSLKIDFELLLRISDN